MEDSDRSTLKKIEPSDCWEAGRLLPATAGPQRPLDSNSAHHLLVKIPIAVADCAPQGGGSPFLPGRHELAVAVDGDRWRSSAAYKFRASRGCGFVKKPDILIKADQDNKVFDPKAKSPVKKTLKARLDSYVVKVYMGDGWHMDFKQTYFDSYSPPDFYAR
ncbi:phospholipase C 2, partial [Perilla frutescens var. hirtella]